MRIKVPLCSLNYSFSGRSFCTANQPKMVRVRFAPSPTGNLHLGGLRTALYNHLYARKYKGKFILRIEDTDQKRLVPGAVERLQNDLLWAGIEINEGPNFGGPFGPYLQSERLEIYHKHINKLIENGAAYYCFCSDMRLKLLRKHATVSQEIPKYDNKCRHMTNEERQEKLEKNLPYCVRFKIPNQTETFYDIIYGEISYNIALNEGDPVILKSDGFPTYHFANVVDDHLMEITHVLRGVEWQISTTKHILLYKAFDWIPPVYGHLPLLMNTDGTKLSKRQGDITLESYRNRNIFPLALLNFIVNSGGGFRKDLERHLKPKIYTIDELCDQFDVSSINSHSGKLMSERLLEFNQLELKRQFKNLEMQKILVNNVISLVRKKFPNEKNLDLSENHVKNVLEWSLDRIETIQDLVSENMKFIWLLPENSSFKNVDKNMCNLLSMFKASPIFKSDNNVLTKEVLSVFLKEFSKEHNLNYGSFMKSLRLILSGLNQGPGVAEMIEILGKENTLKRIDFCIKNLR